ncbi:Guanine nucleotide binding protein (G protein), beta polypeptide 1-like [Quaeritorhiza haematococci]|nr:Guanine nucleotide binding protein (G protein), beta polypeptide 1-like [Quaeritorhiza haematococci]
MCIKLFRKSKPPTSSTSAPTHAESSSATADPVSQSTDVDVQSPPSSSTSTSSSQPATTLSSVDSDGQILIAAGYENGVVIVWDAMKGKMIGKMKHHEEPVLALDITSDGSYGFSGGADSLLVRFSTSFRERIFNFKDGTPAEDARTIDVKYRGLSDVRVRGDDRIVATGGWDAKIRIFGVKKFTPLAILKQHRESVFCIAFPKPTTRTRTSTETPSPSSSPTTSLATTTTTAVSSDSLSINNDMTALTIQAPSSKERTLTRRRFVGDEGDATWNLLMAGSKDTRISLWRIY